MSTDPVCLEKIEDISWLPPDHIIRVPRGTGEVRYVAGTNEVSSVHFSNSVQFLHILYISLYGTSSLVYYNRKSRNRCIQVNKMC